MSTDTGSPTTIPLYIEQNEARLLLQADLQGVVHGTLSPGGDPATLLVLLFQFQGRTERNRFRRAEIKIRFTDEQSPLSDQDPETLALWPEGDFTFNESEVDINTDKGGNATISAGVPAFQLGLGGNWSRNTSRKQKERASVNGARRIEGRNWGSKNVVRLILDENHDQKHGIVTAISVAILLKRKTMTDRFVAHVEVSANADLKYDTVSRLRSLSGRTPVNDPVIFDPKHENNLDVKDVSNLAGEDLESKARIISTTLISTIQDATAK
ncbi:hypothetical protein N7540_003689 [Penicillium herquei]|nr:hypothetical protein N7540_003689 [Penicillium herquei]